jgi:hypothetical protein
MPVVFEEVDEFTFKNRESTVQSQDDMSPRYTHTWVKKTGDLIEFGGVVSTATLGTICRMLGATIPTQTVDGGWLREPETVFVKRPRGGPLLHYMNGGNFIPQPHKKAA